MRLLLFGLAFLVALPYGISDVLFEPIDLHGFTLGPKQPKYSFSNETEPGHEKMYTYRSICMTPQGEMRILHGFDCRYQVAVGRFRNAVNDSGWTFLEIETKPDYPPEIQAYAAGVLEGNLSSIMITYHIHNAVENYCKNYSQYCERLKDFIQHNMKWIKTQLDTKNSDDLYWAQVNRTLHQLTGIYNGFDGAKLNPHISYDFHPILMINMNGDLYDLEKKLNKTVDPNYDRCSGFVKVAPNNSDLFISQVTMSGYQNMMRVLKLYKFGYDKKQVPGHTSTFSSYPGLMYSSDDFALMSSGLANVETTYSIFNMPLFDYVRPVDQVPAWMRVKVANELASTAKQWCQIFERYNSGTYNNQWVIVDYKRFKPGHSLPPNELLYVLEQVPGTIVYRDLTWYLRKYTYFPSYNVPFFKNITSLSGYDKYADKNGDWFRWGASPRAHIFERDHHKVVDINSLAKLMRYNDYTHDEFSRCNCTPPYSAEAAISARGDLNPPDGIYPIPIMGHRNHGGLDYKGTNYTLFKKLSFRAIGGPTYDDVPPFQWSKFDFDKKVNHVGHPDLWKFEEIETKWETDVRAEL